MKKLNALISLLVTAGLYVSVTAAFADSPNANSSWKFDWVFNCGPGLPGSQLNVSADRGGSGRSAGGQTFCDTPSTQWTGNVDGWVLFTIETGSPVTTVTLDITVNGDLCATTTAKKSGPGPAATLPADLNEAWASVSCEGVSQAVYGPYQ